MAHAGVVGAIEDLSQLLIGEDPTRVEHLWQMMYRQHFWHGSGIVRATAIAGSTSRCGTSSARSTACPATSSGAARCATTSASTAISAAANGELLRDAGRQREALRRSGPASGRRWLHGVQVHGRAVHDADRGAEADQGRRSLRRGDARSGRRRHRHHGRLPRAAIAGDGHAVRQGLEPYGLYFLEEPCWPESIDGLAAINAAVTTPIATGERVTHLAAFRDLFAARGCEICQLDITHCGGLSEARRIAALAEAYRIALAPHNPQGPVSTAASLEFGFSQPSYIICEAVHNDVPWRQDVVQEGFTVDRSTRTVRPTRSPAWASRSTRTKLASIRSSRNLLQRVFYATAAWATGRSPRSGG